MAQQHQYLVVIMGWLTYVISNKLENEIVMFHSPNDTLPGSCILCIYDKTRKEAARIYYILCDKDHKYTKSTNLACNPTNSSREVLRVTGQICENIPVYGSRGVLDALVTVLNNAGFNTVLEIYRKQNCSAEFEPLGLCTIREGVCFCDGMFQNISNGYADMSIAYGDITRGRTQCMPHTSAVAHISLALFYIKPARFQLYFTGHSNNYSTYLPLPLYIAVIGMFIVFIQFTWIFHHNSGIGSYIHSVQQILMTSRDYGMTAVNMNYGVGMYFVSTFRQNTPINVAITMTGKFLLLSYFLYFTYFMLGVTTNITASEMNTIRDTEFIDEDTLRETMKFSYAITTTSYDTLRRISPYTNPLRTMAIYHNADQHGLDYFLSYENSNRSKTYEMLSYGYKTVNVLALGSTEMALDSLFCNIQLSPMRFSDITAVFYLRPGLSNRTRARINRVVKTLVDVETSVVKMEKLNQEMLKNSSENFGCFRTREELQQMTFKRSSENTWVLRYQMDSILYGTFTMSCCALLLLAFEFGLAFCTLKRIDKRTHQKTRFSLFVDKVQQAPSYIPRSALFRIAFIRYMSENCDTYRAYTKNRRLGSKPEHSTADRYDETDVATTARRRKLKILNDIDMQLIATVSKMETVPKPEPVHFAPRTSRFYDYISKRDKY